MTTETTKNEENCDTSEDIVFDAMKEEYEHCVKRSEKLDNKIYILLTVCAFIFVLLTSIIEKASTFQMSQDELYHAIHPEDRNGKDTELRADQYAYRLLINLIMQQKKNEVPEELQVFWEDQYLSPIILFEMFRLFDVYSELKGKKIVYQDHPTPKERQDNIFSMFKDDIPEEMNTEEGNKVLNLILNSSEYAEDWLRYKISKGKL